MQSILLLKNFGFSLVHYSAVAPILVGTLGIKKYVFLIPNVSVYVSCHHCHANRTAVHKNNAHNAGLLVDGESQQRLTEPTKDNPYASQAEFWKARVLISR